MKVLVLSQGLTSTLTMATTQPGHDPFCPWTLASSKTRAAHALRNNQASQRDICHCSVLVVRLPIHGATAHLGFYPTQAGKVSSTRLRRALSASQEQEEEEVKPAPAAETAQYDRGKSMRSEDPNFQQKQEERCEARKTAIEARSECQR